MRERVTRCCPALSVDWGICCQREEQREPLGAGMDISKLSGFVVRKAVYFSSCSLSGSCICNRCHRKAINPSSKYIKKKHHPTANTAKMLL